MLFSYLKNTTFFKNSFYFINSLTYAKRNIKEKIILADGISEDLNMVFLKQLKKALKRNKKEKELLKCVSTDTYYSFYTSVY